MPAAVAPGADAAIVGGSRSDVPSGQVSPKRKAGRGARLPWRRWCAADQNSYLRPIWICQRERSVLRVTPPAGPLADSGLSSVEFAPEMR